jgi:hypothetical protein
MSRIMHGQSRHRSHVRKPLTLGLSAAVLSLLALGSIAAPAQAGAGLGEDPLLDAIPVNACPNDTIRMTDWNSTESQSAAVACLVNKVRARAGLPPLLYCTQVGTGCNLSVSAGRRTNAELLDQAAQWKAMDVDYMCSTAPSPALADAHQACNRPIDYRARSTGVAYPPTWVFWENLGAGNYDGGLDRNPAVFTPRQVVNNWLAEPFNFQGRRPHREAILDGANAATRQGYTALGVGVTPAWWGGLAPDGQPAVARAWGRFRQVYCLEFMNI